MHSHTNYSASSKYLCCIFEIWLTMKVLVKCITATRKTFLWWLLALLLITVIHSMGVIRKLTESAWTFALKRTRRHLNYSTEKPAFKCLVKTTSAHRHTESRTKVMLLILVGTPYLHFTSCLHAKSHQSEQIWTVCSWHSAMLYLKWINGKAVVGMNVIKQRKM